MDGVERIYWKHLRIFDANGHHLRICRNGASPLGRGKTTAVVLGVRDDGRVTAVNQVASRIG